MVEKTKSTKIKSLKKLTTDLLKGLETEAEVKILEEDGLFKISLTSKDPSVLIGHHGRNLFALQTILSQMSYRQIGEFRVLVDVDDYRKQREDQLRDSALELAERVKSSGKEQSLVPMSSFERRIIHLALSEDEGVETISDGEKENRHIIIKLKG